MSCTLRLIAPLLAALALIATGCADGDPVISPEQSSLAVDRSEGIRADGQDAVSVTVTLRDADGNPVKGAVPKLSVGGTGNTVPTLAATDAEGVSKGTLRSTVAETKSISAHVEREGGNVTVAQKVSVRFVAGAPVKLGFAVPPSTVPAREPLFPAMQVRIEDAHGNTVASANANVTIAIEEGPAGAVLEGATSAATVEGQAAFPELRLPRVGTYRLRATASGFEPVVSDPFDVTSGPPSRLTFLTQPADRVAGESFGVQVALQDEAGNLVSHLPLQVSLALGNAMGAQLTGTKTAEASGGVAQFNGLSVQKAGEGYTLVATAPGYGGATSQTFTVSTAGPSLQTSTLAFSPEKVEANGVDVTEITFTVRDAFGNPVADWPVTLSATGTGNTLSDESGTTGPDGTFTATLASTVAELKALRADMGASAVTKTVQFVAGLPVATLSELEVTPATFTAGASTTVTVRLRDAHGNAVEGEQVELTSSGAGTGDLFDETSASTGGGGVFSTTFTSTSAAVKTITAQFSTGQVSAQVTVTAAAPTDMASALLVTPPGLAVADGVASAELGVVLMDAFGNFVPGVPVTFAASGTGNTFTPSSGTTDAQGLLVTQLRSTKAEAKTVEAQVTGLPTMTGQVLFVAGPAVASRSTFSASPASVAAGTASTFTLVLRDAHDNPAPDQSVTFESSVASDGFSPPGGLSDATGTLTTDVTGTQAGTRTINALFGSETLGATLTVTAAAASVNDSQISASPTEVVADGVSAATVSILVRDSYGNPVPNVAVTLSANGSGQTFTPASGATNSSGAFTTQVRSTQAEANTVVVTLDGGDTLTAEILFTPTHYTVAVSYTGFGSVSSQPGGISCGTTCSALFTAGSTVTLTAVPYDASYRVGSWSGCTSTSPNGEQCVVTVSENTAVSVNFEPVPFDWVDACAVPGMTRHFLSQVDDQTTPAITLPFTFHFKGTAFSSVVATSNGYLGFGTATTQYSNSPLPVAGMPPDAIFAFWDDLMTVSNEGICHATVGSPGNRRFVVTWSRMIFYPAANDVGTDLTFSLILDEGTNAVKVSYLNLTSISEQQRALGSSATVGWQSSAGGHFQHSHEQAVLAPGMTLDF